MFYKHNVSTLDYIVSPSFFFASMCRSTVLASPWLILIEQVPLFIFIFLPKAYKDLRQLKRRSVASSKKVLSVLLSHALLLVPEREALVFTRQGAARVFGFV
jgi:hypothetical protein